MNVLTSALLVLGTLRLESSTVHAPNSAMTFMLADNAVCIHLSMPERVSSDAQETLTQSRGIQGLASVS